MLSRSQVGLILLALVCLGLIGLAIGKTDWRRLRGAKSNQRAQVRAPGPPIQLDPVNPHYFSFRGQTTPLIGASPGYGMITNLDVNYVSLLNQLGAAGLNKIRVFTGDFVIVDSAKGNDSLHARPNRFVMPWARSTTAGYAGSAKQFKFDLDTWDNQYFDRLKGVVRQASEKGMVVEASLFSQHYNNHIWSYSPLNSSNNVNRMANRSWEEFFSLSDPELVARQDAYVQKIVKELNAFDNVYFEIANEAWGAAWHDHIAKTITQTESALPNRHLIALDGAELYSEMTALVSVLNVHYVNDLTAAGNLHWIAAFPLLDNYYDRNIALGFDETAVISAPQSAEDARVEAWEFIVGGGGVYDNLSPQPNRKLSTYLRSLKEFILGFDLRRMRQDKSVISSTLSSGAIWRASSDQATQYAIYVHHSNSARGDYDVVNSTFVEHPQLSLPPGNYAATWINPSNGKPMRTVTISSQGQVELESPPFVGDIALKIVKVNEPK